MLAMIAGAEGSVVLLGIILTIIPAWRIAIKAGYAGPLAMLTLIPFVNLIVALIFAFSEWPIEKKLKAISGQAKIEP